MDSDKFIQSSVPAIWFYCDNEKEEILLFHRKENCLFKFYMPKILTNEQIDNSILMSLADFDWDKPFDELFIKQQYRKALMNVANILIGE